MRLICPNCDAQYEVDDAVIPEGGRDVQCSSCGHTWFQAAHPADAPDEGATPRAAEAIPPEALRRRSLDDAVLSVLREEAERETRAREAEGSSLETQTDLGLSAPRRTAVRSTCRARATGGERGRRRGPAPCRSGARGQGVTARTSA